MANSDVKLKHKVKLRKKVESTEVSGKNGGKDLDSTPNEPKSKAWQWICLGVIVLGIITGYMFFSKSVDKVAETSVQEIEAVAETSIPTDTVIVDEVSNCGYEAADITETQSSDAVEMPATENNTSTASSSTPANVPNVSDDVEAEAMKVIRGDYGIGRERKDKLGSKYQTIQSRVNELKREGIF